MRKESTLTERLLRPALSCVFIPLTREDARQEGLRGRSVTGLRNHESESKHSGSQWLLQSSRFQLPKEAWTPSEQRVPISHTQGGQRATAVPPVISAHVHLT